MPLPRTIAGEEAVRAFGRRLEFLIYLEQMRLQRGVTQRDIAEGVSGALGLDPPLRVATVSRWVLGQSVPDVVVMGALAAYFGADPGWLAFGEQSRAPQPASTYTPPL
jgi:transcriptional regulator with XRE-family HTH domain